MMNRRKLLSASAVAPIAAVVPALLPKMAVADPVKDETWSTGPFLYRFRVIGDKDITIPQSMPGARRAMRITHQDGREYLVIMHVDDEFTTDNEKTFTSLRTPAFDINKEKSEIGWLSADNKTFMSLTDAVRENGFDIERDEYGFESVVPRKV